MIAVLGTSRSDGNTRRALDWVIAGRPVEVVDVSALAISPYDYRHENASDDFLPLAERIVGEDGLLLATPVYWYTMSFQLKLFLDRFSDLITIRKDLGRGLKGKRVYLVASSAGPALPPGFEEPFRLTCRYFGMAWGGSFHAYFRSGGKPAEGAREEARAFGAVIFEGRP